MAVKWKWKPAAGGSVPAGLEQKVNQNTTNITNLQTKTNNIEQNYSTKQYVNDKIQKRVIDRAIPASNSYTIQPSQGYEIISIMVGRKRTTDGFYFFNYHANLNFQLFLHTDGSYQIYTQGPVGGFGPDYRIIVVEKKI